MDKAASPAYLKKRFERIEEDPKEWTAWMRRQAGLTPGGPGAAPEYLYSLSDHTGDYGTVLACAPPDTFFWMVDRYKATDPSEYDFDGLLMFLRGAGIHVRRERRKNPVNIPF